MHVPYSTPLGLVHTDLAGAVDSNFQETFRYWLTLTANFSAGLLVYFAKNKCDTVASRKKLLAESDPHGKVTLYQIKQWRWVYFLRRNCIRHDTCAPHWPRTAEQHGGAKLENPIWKWESACSFHPQDLKIFGHRQLWLQQTNIPL